MKTSARALQFIKDHEGWRDTAYYDQVGRLTIGYGHTTDNKYPIKKGMKITKAKGNEMLIWDVEEAEGAIDKLVKVPLNSNQYGALVSFIFNLGNQAFANSTVLVKLNQNDFIGAMKVLNMYVKGTVNGKKVVLPGLVRRGAEEVALFNTPVALENKVVKQPVIPVPTPETVDAREAKGNVEKETEPTPIKEVLTAVVGAATAASAPVLDWFGQLRSYFDEKTALYVVGGVAVLAVVYLFYRLWKKRQES